MFLRRAEPDDWPDLSDAALAASPDWLAPYLTGKSRLAEIGADDLAAALHAELSYEQSRRLDIEAPTHFVAPTGNAFAVDYRAIAGPPSAVNVVDVQAPSRSGR